VYQALYARVIPNLPVEAMSWGVTVSTVSASIVPAARPRATPHPPHAATRRLFDAAAARWDEVPVYERGALAAGNCLVGPALVGEDQTTTVVPRGFSARVDAHGHLVLERTGQEQSQKEDKP
jgi:N-methylhydantoinase A